MTDFCLKEFDYSPTKEQQEFLNFLMSNEFPLFYNRQTSEKYMYYSHALMQRNKDDLPEGGIINSPYFDYAKNFFLEVCSKNNVEVKTILRGSVNNTIYHPDKCGDIHVDHLFPHYNFIYHLNETNAPTRLYDENDNFVKQSNPKKNRAVVFSGMRHAQAFAEPHEQRIVLVFTFLGSIH